METHRAGDILRHNIIGAAGPATSSQVTKIEQFLTGRNLYFDDFDRLWSLLEAHRADERCPGDGARITVAHATQIMAWLERNHGAGARRPGHPHSADRNGNCVVCGAEMSDPNLAASH